jgi:gamma-glutamyltranspeptidase / glutathione hydrolase
MKDPLLGKFPESKRIFQRNGDYYKPGEVFKQPELARTLERIAQNPDDFYKGEIATQIATFESKNGGNITAKDLADYEAKERQPVHGTYRGLEVYSAPPPSSGGVALIETLNILEGYDLKKLGNRSGESMHLTIEAFRRAFYDRAEFMGDPDFSKVPVAELIDKKYGVAWRENLSPDKASASADLKRPAAFKELDRYAATHPQPKTVREPEHTTHYSVVDPDGNAVSVTTTLNFGFGSGVTVEGLGFLLNDEMDDFAVAPGVPNAYGLRGGAENAPDAGKEPLSSMAPTFVFAPSGELRLAVGAAGGPTIPTTVAQIIVHVVDDGMKLDEAIAASRIHHNFLPDAIRIEKNGLEAETEKALEARGHVLRVGRFPLGKACGVEVDPATGFRAGSSDPRFDGAGAIP